MIVVAAAGLASPAFALEKGDWIVRAGPAWVLPNDDSGSVTGIPGSEVSVDDNVTLGFTIGYMLTDNISLEVLGAFPSEHDIDAEGSIGALGNIGSAKVLPPTFSIQYQFLPKAKIRPYVGAGINYTMFFDEDTSSSLENALGGKTKLSLDNSWGLAAHAGVDFVVKDNWFVNFTAWYVDMDTEATLKTNGVKRKVDVDIDPWVLLLAVGTSF
ncbi:MAG: outer membrane beta-barrel protein [Gammaproteobacteria bacterium]|nr:outer membrane beta-barrel protein [Gammaproteobacteria bacterium]MCP5423536.1 outer membrane beta-barrel protein [Gammaproteobacteria bacterium]